MMQITKDKEEFLVRVLGQASAARIIAEAETTSKALDAQGVRHKEGATSFAELDATAVISDVVDQLLGIIGNTVTGDEPIDAKVKLVADAMREAADRVGMKLTQKDAVATAEALLRTKDRTRGNPAAVYVADAGLRPAVANATKDAKPYTIADVEAESPAGPYLGDVLRGALVQGRA